MVAKETLDTLEEATDIVEQTLDIMDDLWCVPKSYKKKLIISGVMVGAGVALATGTTVWLISKKRLTAKYEEVTKKEIEEAKAFYARLYKQDDFETPQRAVEALGADAAVEALERYQGRGRVVEEDVEVEVTPITETKTKNIFTENEPTSVWDLEEEIKNRTDDEPYVISQEEYQEAERDYLQHTLAYYAEDDVLVDEQEKPIEEVDKVVGEGNLMRFGHGSNDNRIVYIRNDRLSLDFEVVKNEGSYAKDVLGFQHDDGGHKIHKFRGDDD